MSELRFGLVDADFLDMHNIDSKLLDVTDAEAELLKAHLEDTGRIWSLKGFIEAFNTGEFLYASGYPYVFSTEGTEKANAPTVTKHWGVVETVDVIADGFYRFTTPSHGGFELSDYWMSQMPDQYKECSFTGDNCFEEDLSWCAVVVAFPFLFSRQEQQDAQAIYDKYFTRKASLKFFEPTKGA